MMKPSDIDGVLTYIQHVAPTTCVEMQWRVACRAILRLELSDKLIKACLMRYMCTREL